MIQYDGGTARTRTLYRSGTYEGMLEGFAAAPSMVSFT